MTLWDLASLSRKEKCTVCWAWSLFPLLQRRIGRRAQAQSTGLCFIRAGRSPIDNPVGERPRQRIDEQCEEECGDEQEQRQDDVLLVVAPHQVEKTLEGVGEPGEGGVRAAEEAGQGSKGWVRCCLPWQHPTDFLPLLFCWQPFPPVGHCGRQKPAKKLPVLQHFGDGNRW